MHPTQTAQSFLPAYSSPPTGANKVEWREASEHLAARLLRYATYIAVGLAAVGGLMMTAGTSLVTTDVMVRSAVRPLALPLILAVLFAGPIGASEGVLIARRSFPFLATAYLATTALLPPALLMVKRRGGPVMLIWACFAAFQAFRASIFTWRVWGQRLIGSECE